MQQVPEFDEIRELGSGAFGTVTEVRLRFMPIAQNNNDAQPELERRGPVRPFTWRKKLVHRCKDFLCRSTDRDRVQPVPVQPQPAPAKSTRLSERRFALKTIRTGAIFVENEYNSLVTLRGHPNVIKLFNRYYDRNQDAHSLLFELCRGGDLLSMIEKDTHPLLRTYKREEFCRQVCKQLGSALQQAHSRLIIHRDVKLENVFFRDEACTEIILGDWGLSVQLTDPEQRRYDPCGSVHYAAPELILHGEHSFAVDMWSLGIVCFAVLTGKFPFYGANTREIQNSIVSREAAPLPSWVSDDCKRCIRKLLVRDPQIRMTADELFNEPWLAELS